MCLPTSLIYEIVPSLGLLLHERNVDAEFNPENYLLEHPCYFVTHPNASNLNYSL